MSIRLSTNHLAVIGCVVLCACGVPDGTVHAGANGDRITPRHGTVIVEACVLSADQSASVASPTMQRMVQDIVLRCLQLDAHGGLSTITGDPLSAARQQVDSLHALGYHVSYALTTSAPDNPDAVIASTEVLVAAPSALADPALGVDGIDIALPALSNQSTAALTSFVTALSASIRPTRTLAIWAPPSDRVPSDIPGGDAYDLGQLGPLVDRVRLMTLDYSCCGAPPGPTTDTGWAVDVARLAAGITRPPLDVALPLYGYRFNSNGASATPIGYGDATSDAAAHGITPTRDPRGPLTFSDATGTWWYDDADSTLRYLLALDTDTLSATTGIVFYGLGAEDPALWNTLAEALP